MTVNGIVTEFAGRNYLLQFFNRAERNRWVRPDYHLYDFSLILFQLIKRAF